MALWADTTRAWEARRDAWRLKQNESTVAASAMTCVRGDGVFFLGWGDLCAVAATSRAGLDAGRAAVRRIRADITRGAAGELAVPCVGRPPDGSAPFPDGFSYARRVRVPPPHLDATDDATSGVYAKVVVAWQNGWSLRTAVPLEAGARVCDYTGDLVSRRAARGRERWGTPTYVLSLVEHSFDASVPAWRTTVDATDRGGVGRFIDHACDPSLELRALRKSPAHLVPVLAFFTRRPLPAGAPLTFDYAGLDDHPGGEPPPPVGVLERSETRCSCGAPNCRRWLPRLEDDLDRCGDFLNGNRHNNIPQRH
ncbi:hypothetical protein CTAYLR_007832 [Chrysophaeum taylorii]|uniref:Post-SET domain-containing protein n=1 Tax=Chrysophaeum taylorii TaxID=2483200 RepID=A0AAD7XH01_9STRA|nr:hypothetical protein CTAYLR_007832 [Chrysophaeum taylorii]